MDWQIRIALIVVGLGLIGFILYDYQQRKKKQLEKQKLIEQMRQSAEQVDAAGFDFTGVGSVRRAGYEDYQETTSAESLTEKRAPLVHPQSENQEYSESLSVSESRAEETIDDFQIKKDEVSEQHKPTITEKIKQKQDAFFSHKKNSQPTEQLGLNVDTHDEKKDTTVPAQPELVFSLIIKAAEEQAYVGAEFMPILLSQGLRHGDMGIFHRHSGAAGKPGPIMYSLANALKPGTFDLTDIERFSTPAFAIFMTVPGALDPVSAYENMVKTARLLQQELGGQILDETKSVFTEQTYQHHLDKLKDYLFKSSVKKN